MRKCALHRSRAPSRLYRYHRPQVRAMTMILRFPRIETKRNWARQLIIVESQFCAETRPRTRAVEGLSRVKSVVFFCSHDFAGRSGPQLERRQHHHYATRHAAFRSSVPFVCVVHTSQSLIVRQTKDLVIQPDIVTLTRQVSHPNSPLWWKSTPVTRASGRTMLESDSECEISKLRWDK